MIRYIADTHFDSEDLIFYDNRPFETAEEMNEALIANWNRVVGDEERPTSSATSMRETLSDGARHWRN